MSEGPEATSGPESSATGIDPVAMALAMHGASREKADAFLDDQRNHLNEQFKHLAEQYKQLRLGTWEKRLGVLLRIATAFTGLAIAAGFAFLIWNAANSNDLIMDAFSVPPDMADKGMTGAVMAGDVSNRISDMLARYPNSMRAPQSYANGFGDGIKIEIPETGVSLSELDRFLREKLGHDVHITGAVLHTPGGLKLTARAGALGGATIEGAESDLDSLQQRLAEALFGITQPYRYGVYLANSARFDEAEIVYRKLVNADSIRERAWGYVGLGNIAARAGKNSYGANAARDFYLRALELGSGNGVALQNLSGTEGSFGHAELSLALLRKFQNLLTRADHGQIRAERMTAVRREAEAAVDATLGAFHEAAEILSRPEVFALTAISGPSARVAHAQSLAHELSAARSTMENPLQDTPGRATEGALFNERERMQIAVLAGNWADSVKGRPALEAIVAKAPSLWPALHMNADTYLAFALAKLGRFDEAEKLVADMPADCYPCLIARAQIAEIRGQHARANWWFVRATAAAPSIPFAEFAWGQSLLERGQPNAAIEKFKLANQKGPHFADPLEGWGEALMAKNQSHLALAKFAEAEKYAPNWGRLHLKWGEALVYAGKKDEAQKQFARARELDLTPSEKVELVGMSHG